MQIIHSGLHSNFYPRSPCGERPAQGRKVEMLFYFYPRSPCGERPVFDFLYLYPAQISIHALLAESDFGVAVKFNVLAKDFYPRSPCGERQGFPPVPLRGQADFYPRSPCGERRVNSMFAK